MTINITSSPFSYICQSYWRTADHCG